MAAVYVQAVKTLLSEIEIHVPFAVRHDCSEAICPEYIINSEDGMYEILLLKKVKFIFQNGSLQ